LIAVRHPDHDDFVRIYIKGAPEIIVSKCSRTYHVDGKVIPMEDSQTNYILNDILIQKFTTASYRTLAFAYKDITVEDFESLKSQYNDFVTEEDRNVLEKDLTFIGLFALHDPIREKVNRSVLYAQKGQINVRLVSGDHIETAKALAVQAGIMDDPSKYTCLTGEEFRSLIGGIRQEIQEDGSVRHYVERRDEFRALITGKDNRKPLRVIARATSYDKYMLVIGLRDLGRTVATIGEGLNDVDALKTADVGFAMGSGVSIAKDNSDMILINDNFESTMMAVMWGRNIYQNVRRFIQFQVTVNLSAMLFVIMGAATKGTSPLSINQLLWINLIMDTFAAIALGSERPHPSIIRNPPIKEREPLMTTSMWKQIYGMTLYVFVMSTIMYFFIDNMWDDIDYENSSELYENGVATDKAKAYTMMFNTFVWMHIFNEFNCRKVGATQFNVMKGLLTNWMFLVVMAVIIALQIFFVEYGGEAMQTTPLTGQQHAACIMWGATTLLVSVVLKMLPNKITEKIPALVNEDQDQKEDKLLNAFNKQAQAKVSKKN